MSESPFDTSAPWLHNAYNLDRRVLKAVSKLGFTFPTLVQAKCVPLALEGKDLLVRARTGSGKTLAFAIPAIQKLLLQKESNSGASTGVQCVILAPTKELIKQIAKVVTDLTYYCRDVLSMVTITDEMASKNDYKLQSSPDIVLSTPAKLVQLLPLLALSTVHLFILDEADLVLSYGYKEDIHKITSAMPKIFQGILVSATLSAELDKFKRVLLHKPVILKLQEAQAVNHLLQFYLDTTEEDKFLILYVFLKLGILQGKGLIFVNDINKCYKVKLFLQQFFISAAVLNAEIPLNTRTHILEEFNRGVFDYLIATDASVDTGEEDDEGDDEEEEEEGMDKGGEEGEDDDEDDNIEDMEDVPQSKPQPLSSSEKKQKDTKTTKEGEEEEEYGVSRGIDFQSVHFVLNFDFPLTPAAYIHRIGRTARGGNTQGLGLSFVLNPPARGGRKEQEKAMNEWGVLGEVQGKQPTLTSSSLLENDHIFATLHNAAQIGGGAGGSGEERGGGGHEGVGGYGEQGGLQPAPLVFNRDELESFRYRVSDVYRSVTKVAIKEFRAAELRRELLHSETLQTYFQQHPQDLKILRHDKAILHPIRQKDHLKHLPTYLIPASMRGLEVQSQGRHSKRNRRQQAKRKEMKKEKYALSKGNKDDRKMKDPLFNANLMGGGDENEGDGEDEEGEEEEGEGFVGEAGGMGGEGLSGRKRWKQSHKKGEYNPRNTNKKAHRVQGTFLKSRKY